MIATSACIRLVIDDVNMTDFSAGTRSACDHLAIDDDATADTGTKCGKYQVIVALSTAAPHLAKCCHVRVISCLDGHLQKSAEHFINIHDAPSKVDCLVYHTVIIDRSRYTDSDTDHRILCDSHFLHLAENGSCDIGKNIVAIIICSGRYFPLFEHRALRIEKSDLYCCST